MNEPLPLVASNHAKDNMILIAMKGADVKRVRKQELTS